MPGDVWPAVAHRTARRMCVVGALALAACAGGSSDRPTDAAVGSTMATAPEPTTTVAVTSRPPSTPPSATTSPATVTGTSTEAGETTGPPPTRARRRNPPRSTMAPRRTTTTAPDGPPDSVYVVPVRDVAAAGWGPGHSGYPATDVFLDCGAEVVSPVDGTLGEVRRVDRWDPAVDNPATRGGRSVTIIGVDGVRYYLSHLDDVDAALAAGGTVAAGDRLGTVGLTGRTSACHIHFGMSPPCDGKEWSVRRGAVEPAPYLDAWRDGVPASPVDEVRAWSTANPDACALAVADPYAPDA